MAILESKLKNGKNNDQKNSENNYACKTFNIHVWSSQDLDIQPAKLYPGKHSV